MTDAEPQLCVRFWSIFRERVFAINLRNTNLGDWLASFFLDFLAQGNVDHSWFAFPPLGTKEDEPIAFAIIRLIVEVSCNFQFCQFYCNYICAILDAVFTQSLKH